MDRTEPNGPGVKTKRANIVRRLFTRRNRARRSQPEPGDARRSRSGRCGCRAVVWRCRSVITAPAALRTRHYGEQPGQKAGGFEWSGPAAGGWDRNWAGTDRAVWDRAGDWHGLVHTEGGSEGEGRSAPRGLGGSHGFSSTARPSTRFPQSRPIRNHKVSPRLIIS